MLHADILGERARLTPDREALFDVERAQRYTYRELDQRAVSCARVLQSCCGLERGDRLAILARNRLEYIDVYFAAAKTGLVLVNLNTRLASPELSRVINDSGARVLLYDQDFEDEARTLCEKHRLAGCFGLSTELAQQVEALPPAPDWRPVRCVAADVHSLIYTSGTMGRPKGVMITHQMVGWNAYNTVISWQLSADDVSPVFTPLYHAAGFGVFILPLFAAGGRIVLHHDFDPGQVLRCIAAERASVVLGVPTIFKMLAEHADFEQVDLSKVRWMISGGSPLPRHLVDRYASRGVVLKQGFGMTEAGVNCFAMSDAEATRKAGTIGRPMLFHEARVVDEAGAVLPAGEVGRLQLRGPHVTPGYWNDSTATAQAFDDEDFFDTGDLARVDAEGFFTIAGRAKEMFISGGVNVYPAEIEGALLQDPRVLDAAVIGVPDAKWGEVGAAYVVLREGQEALEVAELRAFLQEHLARFKLPKKLFIRTELPRTDYGKVRKKELLERYLEEQK